MVVTTMTGNNPEPASSPAANPAGAPSGPSPTGNRAHLWIGPAGWSYEDWYGIVYPPRLPRGITPLEYLAQFFNAVEVNATFYRLPTARMAAAWPSQVPDDFRFSFKLTQSFTHRRAQFPAACEVEAYCAGIEPVRAAGKLGPLLAQFPWSFRYSAESADWLARLAAAFSPYERVIEVRHSSWNCDAGLAAIRAAGGMCNVDQPALRNCLPPARHVFGPIGYARLHGRNEANWFAEDQPAFERYNYLYDMSALREWAGHVDAMMDAARDVYVVTNNHYRGQAVINALELQALLGRAPKHLPAGLRRAYPQRAAALGAADANGPSWRTPDQRAPSGESDAGQGLLFDC